MRSPILRFVFVLMLLASPYSLQSEPTAEAAPLLSQASLASYAVPQATWWWPWKKWRKKKHPGGHKEVPELDPTAVGQVAVIVLGGAALVLGHRRRAFSV